MNQKIAAKAKAAINLAYKSAQIIKLKQCLEVRTTTR